jgi:hypothetical protein
VAAAPEAASEPASVTAAPASRAEPAAAASASTTAPVLPPWLADTPGKNGQPAGPAENAFTSTSGPVAGLNQPMPGVQASSLSLLPGLRGETGPGELDQLLDWMPGDSLSSGQGNAKFGLSLSRVQPTEQASEADAARPPEILLTPLGDAALPFVPLYLKGLQGESVSPGGLVPGKPGGWAAPSAGRSLLPWLLDLPPLPLDRTAPGEGTPGVRSTVPAQPVADALFAVWPPSDSGSAADTGMTPSAPPGSEEAGASEGGSEGGGDSGE